MRKNFGFRKTNHPAIAGFMLAFGSAAFTALMVMSGGDNFVASRYLTCYLIIAPLMLLSGMVCSIKSFSMIRTRGDKDYAYCGLILNILFLSIYILSLIYIIYRN